MNKAFETARWAIFSVFMGALLVACGGGGGSDSINAVTGITISPADRSYSPDEQQQLTATVTREDGGRQEFTSEVNWSSADIAIATVNGGLFVAISPGTVDITVTVDGTARTESFTVGDQLDRIELRRGTQAVTTASTSLASGETDQLQAIAINASGSEQNVTSQATWSPTASNSSTISVDQAGLVTAAARTSTPVSVRAAFGGFNSPPARYTVTAALQSIRVAPANRDVPVGTTHQFTAFGTFTDGAEEQITNVIWSKKTASNNAISVNASTGLAKGETRDGVGFVVATRGSISSDTTSENGRIAVVAPIATSIDVRPPAGTSTSSSTNNPQLPINTDDQYTANAVFSDGTTGDVTDQADWSSSNPNVAVVDNGSFKGSVSGIAAGTTTISATITHPAGTTPASASDSQNIDVIDEVPSSIQISIVPGSDFNRVAVGFELQFQAMGTFSDGLSRNVTDEVTWSVSVANSIAVIDDGARKGRLTAAGTSSINGVETVTVQATVDANNIGAALDITVENVALTGITVATENTTADGQLPVGETEKYQATGSFLSMTAPPPGFSMDLTDQVSWSIRSPNAPNNEVANATVDNIGEVTAVSAGNVQVRADCGRSTPPQSACNNANQRVNGTDDLTITNAIVVDLKIADVAFQEGCVLSADAMEDDNHLTTTVIEGRSAQLFACATFSDNTFDTGYANSPNITWNEIDCINTTGTECDNFTVSNTTATKGLLAGDLATAEDTISGMVTAVASNAATSANDAVTSNDPISVTVSNAVLEEICVQPNDSDLDCFVRPTDSDVSRPAGVAEQYIALGRFSDGDQRTLVIGDNVMWSVSNTNAASVTPNGSVTGQTDGIGQTVQVIATAPSGENNTTISSASGTGAAFTITAATLMSVAVEPTDFMQPSQTGRALTATATFSDNTTADVTSSSSTTWETSNNAAVTVSNASGNKGQIFARGAANSAAEITATYVFSGDTEAGTANVTVAQGLVTAITVTPANDSVAVNGSQQYTARARRSDTPPGSDGEDVSGDVIWSIVTTGDGGNATITAQGNATGTAAGTVRVFARFDRGDTNGDGSDETVSGNTRLTITE